MPVLPTTIDPTSEAFRANRRALEEAVAGVNWFRRLVGAGVLVWIVARLASEL